MLWSVISVTLSISGHKPVQNCLWIKRSYSKEGCLWPKLTGKVTLTPSDHGVQSNLNASRLKAQFFWYQPVMTAKFLTTLFQTSGRIYIRTPTLKKITYSLHFQVLICICTSDKTEIMKLYLDSYQYLIDYLSGRMSHVLSAI